MRRPPVSTRIHRWPLLLLILFGGAFSFKAGHDWTLVIKRVRGIFGACGQFKAKNKVSFFPS